MHAYLKYNIPNCRKIISNELLTFCERIEKFLCKQAKRDQRLKSIWRQNDTSFDKLYRYVE